MTICTPRNALLARMYASSLATSPTPFDSGSGASASVLRTPIACPAPFTKPLPGRGDAGVSV
ncbi:MAG TPA: hypothetical protein VGO80_05915 [Solirubrobacteraceae bacterium]|nr:hypothetical protein [Solirubrobacteraceae bacterium]